MIGYLWLAACDGDAPVRKPSAQGATILHAIYRDDHRMLLVALRDGDTRRPNADCVQPMLVDVKTGAARAVSVAEAAALQRTMQMTGAVEGTCPVK